MKIKDEFGKSHITQQSIGSDFWFGRSLLRPLQKCPDYRLGFYQITIYNVINVKVKENGVTCSLVRAANTIRLQFGPASLRASSPGGGGAIKEVPSRLCSPAVVLWPLGELARRLWTGRRNLNGTTSFPGSLPTRLSLTPSGGGGG